MVLSLPQIPAVPRSAARPAAAPAGDGVAAVPGYEPPRLVRVRVATAVLTMGKVTAEGHCTRHWHTTNADCVNS